MNILVDIGNSRLKWCIGQGGLFLPGAAIDYRQTDVGHELRLVWRTLPRPEKLAISSVAVPAMMAEIVELAGDLWPMLEIIAPQVTAAAFGVSNAYRQPEKLGIDRWLALLAAHRYYRGFSCVVDCGTAITVDAVDGNGRHLGGLIAPGLLLMKTSLAANTAALDFNPERQAFGLADTTAAAIDSGALLAAAGMIEAVLRRLDRPYQLILSGGDAVLIAGQLLQPGIVDAELVFKGLSIYCNPEEFA